MFARLSSTSTSVHLHLNTSISVFGPWVAAAMGHGHCRQVTSNEPGRIASPVKAQFLVEKLNRLKPFIRVTVVACTCWNLSVVLTGCHEMLACWGGYVCRCRVLWLFYHVPVFVYVSCCQHVISSLIICAWITGQRLVEFFLRGGRANNKCANFRW